MPAILIIGYGNPLRSDDGAGPRAAEEIRRNLSDGSVEVVTCHQLTPELAAWVSESDMVLFVDAEDGGTPGTVRCSEVLPEIQPAPFSHQLSPGAVLGLAQQLFGSHPTAFAFSICGENFEIGEAFSPAVEKNLPDLIAQAAALVNSHQSGNLQSQKLA